MDQQAHQFLSQTTKDTGTQIVINHLKMNTYNQKNRRLEGLCSVALVLALLFAAPGCSENTVSVGKCESSTKSGVRLTIQDPDGADLGKLKELNVRRVYSQSTSAPASEEVGCITEPAGTHHCVGGEAKLLIRISAPGFKDFQEVVDTPWVLCEDKIVDKTVVLQPAS